MKKKNSIGYTHNHITNRANNDNDNDNGKEKINEN